jgi:hypothetical protein
MGKGLTVNGGVALGLIDSNLSHQQTQNNRINTDSFGIKPDKQVLYEWIN